MKVALLSPLIVTSIVSAATIPFTSISSPPTTEDTYDIVFPGSAQSSMGRTSPTNAELMKMGLPLAKPVKLYDSEYLAKRIDPAPPQASSMPPPGSTAQIYRFVSCASSVSYLSPGYSLGSVSLQQKANDCATRSQATGPAANNPSRFVIFPGGGQNCYTQVIAYTAQSCSSGNFGIYEIAP